MSFYRIRPKSGTTSQLKTTLDTKVNEVKKSVANGKNLIANVVGGNQNSTFQVLANNAQTIKTDRDNKLSKVNNLNSQVSSLNTHLTNMTKDRDNWKNIANSKYEIIEGYGKDYTLVLRPTDLNIAIILQANIGNGGCVGCFRITNNTVDMFMEYSDGAFGRYEQLSVPKTIDMGEVTSSTGINWNGTITINKDKTVSIMMRNLSYYKLFNK